MTIKRKRSGDDSPASLCSLSMSGSDSSAPYAQQHDGAMDVEGATRPHGWDFGSIGRVKSGDWGHRTRKRVRDNRPDERAIHENTMHKLFAAQRHLHSASPETFHSPPILAVAKPQKSTLHSFWKQLPAPPVQPPSVPSLHASQDLPHCEDCDALLQPEHESMDVDLDTDMGGAVESSPFACSDCSRNVCGLCAVVSHQRHCLTCATRGRW